LQDDSFASQIKRIKFLVIDEADRMIETGHFAELENIVGLTVRTKEMWVIQMLRRAMHLHRR